MAPETNPIRNVALRPQVASLPKYVPGARPDKDARVHRLASNENPYPPLASVAAELERELRGINRYPDMGTVDLLGELADYLDRQAAAAHAANSADPADPKVAVSIAPDNLVVGTGSVGVFGHILQAFVGPDDEVVYPWRSFEAYPIIVDIVGGRSVKVPLNAAYQIDLPAMAAAVTEKTKVVVVCTPNNPTGTALGHSALREFIAQIPSNVLVIVDEAYLEFVRGEDPVRGLELVAEFPNVMLLRTFSKAYGLAGLRVGYAVGAPDLIAGVRATVIPFGVSTMAQRAAILSLRAHDELMQRVDALVAERARVVAALAAQGWEVPVTQANFVWFPLADRAAQFATDATDAGILVRPFVGDGVRISIGDRDDNDALLTFTQNWIDEHPVH
nr:histidinol-phosphate transaminase [Rarobacter incanus]